MKVSKDDNLLDYTNIAAAIIRQAIEDYKFLIDTDSDYMINNTKVNRSELTSFFMSDWFKTLSCDVIDGRELIKMIENGRVG